MAVVTYQLKNDHAQIITYQPAQNPKPNLAGIYPSHGLVGSPEWWEAIASGVLELHTYSGVIKHVLNSGHNDYPEIITEDGKGATQNWYRNSDSAELDSRYEVGKTIEIDYVWQRQQTMYTGVAGDKIKIVVEIRVA